MLFTITVLLVSKQCCRNKDDKSQEHDGKECALDINKDQALVSQAATLEEKGNRMAARASQLIGLNILSQTMSQELLAS